MSNYIIEYIGKEGIKTSELNHTRASKPRPGDVVVWDDDAGYPFQPGTFGRIDGLNKWVDGKYHICCEPGSVFLNDDCTVSISGGPFTSIDPSDLQPTYETKAVSFWNWGDNCPGAGQGVDYLIYRPVFKLVRHTSGVRLDKEG